MIIAASLLFALLFATIIYMIVNPLLDGGKKVQEQLITKTNTTLADMFLFLDLKKIALQTLGAISLVSFFVYFFTHSAFLTLIVAVALAVSPAPLLKYLTAKRKQTITEQLPDFLISASSSMAVGLGLSQAIELSAQEAKGPLGQEFELFLNELRIGVSFESGLDNLYQRIGTIEIQLLVSAMKISREIGGNLAEVLESLSHTIRTKNEMENKIKTLTAQGRLQGIVMVLLPVAVGFALYKMEATGVYMVMLFTEWYGWVTLAVLTLMLSMGYFFIRKIVNIDV